MAPEAKHAVGNPYLEALNRQVADILKKDVDAIRSKDLGMKHINVDNDWILPDLARMALVLGQAWNTPLCDGFRRQDVWDHCVKLIRRVLDSCRNGKWWRELPGTGDDNINRFTLISVTDLYLRIGPHLDEELKKKYLLTVEQAAAVQINEYDQVKNRSRGQYPNMDAYFMLIMEETSRILDRSDCHVLAMNYLGYLEDCLFDGGGFVYFLGTNECECYHELIVMTLVRLWDLTHSRRVLDLLRKTLPYYPNVVEPSGVVEYYTDPFWKHTWRTIPPYAMDALATLFPDAPEAGEHRYLARVAHPYQKDRQNEMFLVWAMDLWRPEKGVKPRESWIRYDASSRGPRGRSGTFSWAGTTGACQDTFVGAMVAHSPDRYAAVEAVGVDVLLVDPPVKATGAAEYGRRIGTSAFLGGFDYLRRMVVTDRMACMAVSSPVFRGGVAWNRRLPESGWRMRQVWYFDSHRIIGLLSVEPVAADAVAAQAVRLYARLGGSESTVEERDGVYFRGDLCLRVVSTSLPARELKPAYRFYFDNDCKSVELLLSGPAGAKPSSRHWALLEIFPAGTEAANVTPLSTGHLEGFKASAQDLNIAVAFNAGPAAHACDALGAADSRRCYRATAALPSSEPADEAACGSVAPGELAVASVRDTKGCGK